MLSTLHYNELVMLLLLLSDEDDVMIRQWRG
jgi:hypothetical protein